MPIDTQNASKPRPWNVPDKGAADKPGYLTRASLQHAAKEKVPAKNIWLARSSDPREASLISLLNKASDDLKVKNPPALVLFKSDWPEAIDINRKNLAISTGLVDILTPAQLQAMLEQQLSGRDRGAGHFLMKYVVDPTVIIAGAAGAQQLASQKWRSLDIRNIGDPKTMWITTLSLTAAKFVGWELLERWKDRRHEVKMDNAAAQLAGKDTVLNALEAVHRREAELAQDEAPRKWTAKWPEFTRKTPDAQTRIDALKKSPAESFTARVSEAPQTASSAGRG